MQFKTNNNHVLFSGRFFVFSTIMKGIILSGIHFKSGKHLYIYSYYTGTSVLRMSLNVIISR